MLTGVCAGGVRNLFGACFANHRAGGVRNLFGPCFANICASCVRNLLGLSNGSAVANCVRHLAGDGFRNHPSASDSFVDNLGAPHFLADRTWRTLNHLLAAAARLVHMAAGIFVEAECSWIANDTFNARTGNSFCHRFPLATLHWHTFGRCHRLIGGAANVAVPGFVGRFTGGVADVAVAGLVNRFANCIANIAVAGIVNWTTNGIADVAIAGLVDRFANSFTNVAVTGLVDRLANGVALVAVAGLVNRLTNGVALIAIVRVVDDSRAGDRYFFDAAVVHGLALIVRFRAPDRFANRLVGRSTIDAGIAVIPARFT